MLKAKFTLPQKDQKDSKATKELCNFNLCIRIDKTLKVFSYAEYFENRFVTLTKQCLQDNNLNGFIKETQNVKVVQVRESGIIIDHLGSQYEIEIMGAIHKVIVLQLDC